MDVAKYPGLMRRKARYYVRVKVPVDLVGTIGCQDIWRSLKTSDYHEAVRRYFPARTELQEVFEQARRRREANGSLSGEEARRLVSNWFQTMDRRAAEADFGMIGEDRRNVLAETEQELFELIEGADGESVQAALDRVLIDAGWPSRQHVVGRIKTRRLVAHVDGVDTSELSLLLRRGLIELSCRRLDRLNRRASAALDPIFAADAVQPVAQQDAGITLAELIKRFRSEKEPAMSHKLRSDYALMYEVLAELWGTDKPVRSITRDDCRQVRDLFAALPSNAKKRLRGKTLVQAAGHAKRRGIAPMLAKTANQHIARLSTILKWAELEDFITKNPAAQLKVAALESDVRDARRPFSMDQLNTIFNAPLYTGCKDDQIGYMVPGPNVIKRGRFWVPLLALYTGCRMGELCQLGTEDVETEHGVHVLQVRPDPDAGTRVKTKHSRRTVPIHPELIRCGFLEFVAQQREAGQARLFPELPRDRRGSYAGHFQRWANRFLDRAGAKGDRQSFISFRHTFTDALRRAGATGEVIDGILGWTRGNMRDRYGSGPWVLKLAEVMNRVEYPELDLSHLCVR